MSTGALWQDPAPAWSMIPQTPAPASATNTLLTGNWWNPKDFFGIGDNTTANVTGMNETQAKTAQSASAMQNAGLLMSIMGGVSSAIGGYFQAKSQQYQDKSQALNLEYQSDIAAINARSAEYSAQSTLEANKSQVANMTMQAGQQKASATATMAAHGVTLGVGSTADISASQEIVKDVNMYTMDANATRAAAADRTQATNYKNQSLMDRTGAQNALSSASSISPFSAIGGSLLTSASSLASNWNNSQRLKMMLGAGYYGGNSPMVTQP